MAKNIVIERSTRTPIEKQRTEIVERKGIGHPDSISDALAESVSRSLCKMYRDRFGGIMHHNTDETQIVGGLARPRWGGGRVSKPVYILLVGRATGVVDGVKLPIKTLAIEAARDYLDSHFRYLDVANGIRLEAKIGSGSGDLSSLFARGSGKANDTSYGVGFAPFSELETIVKATEHHLYSKGRKSIKSLGEDIKVMGVRRTNRIHLTVAAAMVDRHLSGPQEYKEAMARIEAMVEKTAAKFTNRRVKVAVNTADNRRGRRSADYYLTVTGLSMEMGDDGSVGRGNRVTGLITPNRNMSMEAASGKNPVTHVGKIYNLMAYLMAQDIVKAEPDRIREAHVQLVSRIGKPISEPQVAGIQLVLKPRVKVATVERRVTKVVTGWLDNVSEITDLVVAGKLDTF